MLVPLVVVVKGSEQPREPQPTPSTTPPKVGDEAINEEMFDSVEKAATTASSFEAEQASAQTRSEGVSNLSSDPPLLGGHTLGSGEDNLEHQIELTDNVPNIPHDSPLTGVNTPRKKVKTAQAKEIAGLKRRVTKLEQRQRSRILKNHPFRFGSFRRQSLEVLDTEKAVNTAGEGVSTTNVPETTLVKMKEEKAKEKGVVIKDVKDSSRPVRSITTLQPLQTFDPKEKGKGILQETKSVEKTEKKVQGDAQMERDAEVALRLQAELDEELRARMDANYELTARMTQEEQEKYTIEERDRLYETQQKRIQDFTLMDLEREAQKPGKRLKRVARSYATQKSPKKPKVMKSAKDVTEEEAAEYKKEKEELRLVQERFQDHPLKGHGLLLWGDLRMIFDPDEKDELWMNQLDWKLLRWKLYESCRVYTLFMDGITEKMLNLKLEAEEESTMAFELILSSYKIQLQKSSKDLDYSPSWVVYGAYSEET
ncbi:hypothetical protein Tco_0117684 [Tanacetum coccineum]